VESPFFSPRSPPVEDSRIEGEKKESGGGKMEPVSSKRVSDDDGTGADFLILKGTEQESQETWEAKKR